MAPLFRLKHVIIWIMCHNIFYFAFKNIAKSKKGKQIIESIYNHYGYVSAKDSDFDGLRQYQKIVNKATGGSSNNN